MSQRILTLVGYLLYRLFTSLTGVGYVALTAAFYAVAFHSRTPEVDYFILVVGLFGALITFLLGLSFSAKANDAQSYPFLVRLESRNEYLTAVLLATLFVGVVLQLLVAIAALLANEPQITLSRAAEIPPIWLAMNLLLGVLALHASDFVAVGWSRVGLFGALAVMMLASFNQSTLVLWLAEQARQTSTQSYQQGSAANGEFFQNAATWLTENGVLWVERLFGFAFWPFRAVIDGVIGGEFNRPQALAPAVMVLFATILFMLAADLLAHKDLFLMEE